MFALPAATPVTSPLASTVAIVAEDVVQAIARPVRTLPAASFAVARELRGLADDDGRGRPA